MTGEYLDSYDIRHMLDAMSQNRDHRAAYLAERLNTVMDERIRNLESTPLRAAIVHSTVRITGGEERVQRSMSQKYYHGCRDCSHFSLSFVGAPYIITEEDTKDNDWKENEMLIPRTDEEYEKLKTLFVTHFNKHHREITKNREKDTRKYKIVGKKTEVDADPIPDIHFTIIDEAQHTITDDSTIGAVIPEFEVITDPVTGIARAVRGRIRD